MTAAVAAVSLLRSKLALGLAVVYLALALFVVREDLRPTGGDWISLRGMLTGIVTAPSQATLGTLLGRLGVARIDYTRPGAAGYAQIVAHVLLTLLVVMLLGWGLESAVRLVVASARR